MPIKGLALQPLANWASKVSPFWLAVGTNTKENKQPGVGMFRLGWLMDYPSMEDYLTPLYSTGGSANYYGYSNPQFDRLCDRADVERDSKKRLDLYRQAQAIAVEDAPWSPTYFQRDVELWNPRLRGVEDSLMGHLPHKRTTVQEGK